MSDLISRDAAIAAIEAAKRDFPDAEFMNAEFVINESACIGLSRAALEVSALPSTWVSVNDRLPISEGDYLCYYPHNGNITIRHCYEGDAEGFATSDFTHWMELPALPSG